MNMEESRQFVPKIVRKFERLVKGPQNMDQARESFVSQHGEESLSSIHRQITHVIENTGAMMDDPYQFDNSEAAKEWVRILLRFSDADSLDKKVSTPGSNGVNGTYRDALESLLTQIH